MKRFTENSGGMFKLFVATAVLLTAFATSALASYTITDICPIPTVTANRIGRTKAAWSSAQPSYGQRKAGLSILARLAMVI